MLALVLRRLALLVLIAVMGAPFIVMCLTALKPSIEIATHPLLPATWVWDNLLAPWRDKLPLFFRNSLLLATGTTLLNLLLALPAAYALARLPTPGKKLWRQALIATQMFSPVVVVVSLYRLASSARLVDSLAGLILVNTAYSLAFAIWLLTAYLAAVPDEIEEAAMVDGCSRLSAFWRVLLPVARPGVVTTIVFVFIGAWNEFVIALTFLSSEQNKPLTVGLHDYASAYSPQWNLLMAAALWAIVPVIALFAFIEKHLAEGLTAGAVK
ncbi:MAG: multiple sugar transport system permease protein [Abditibacteriota bacterium]|jgi:multiple sugar transport system permease protein|nr:multiple sugar transport system permease protein [Abditibacteriota bacterium]